ncbi:MAG: beta-galactosidase, partial [Spirochaetaceae bacterium]
MAITIGAQYYRPPFPRDGYWEDDLRRMKESGLDTVQLWMVWGWIEADCGRFDFSDYDRLVDAAGRNGLSVVLSTIAAVHPYWIHREVPDSEMVTNMGQKVVSTNRREIHYGITPGGCIDHPGVRDRMGRFLSACAERYASTDAVIGWDVWNELRWNVHADGLVCYCEHTVAAFRAWLEERYGSLAELNAAWERRYARWDEVLPGKRPGRVYTEMMAFEEFISDRSVEHARWRYRIVKDLNPGKPVTVHGGKPTVLYGTDSYHADESTTALHRGNDWGFAEVIDGVGTSSFPVWEDIDHTDFTSRIDFVRAAAEQHGKALWLSELQGGRSADGFTPQHAVSASVQQRWIWTGLATGAKTILFWCWRDEIFGRESGGFGIIGADGRADERVRALVAMREILTREGALLESYAPEPARVGVWFSPRTYYHSWCEDGDAARPMHALQGLTRALLRNSIPYTIVEEDHTAALDALSVLFMPRAIVVEPHQADAIDRFVERGGTLVTESETGAFGANGLYRYQDERFLARYGIVEQGRRPLPADIVPVS